MSLIPKRFLFQFRFPCHSVEKLWSTKGAGLEESHRVPDLSSLEIEELPPEALKPAYELRAGWNERGLAFSISVFGKKRYPWCRSVHPEESDGLQICLDTRDVKDVHRATRFCHRLVFLPMRDGSGKADPCVIWLPIHRAKGHPNPIDLNKIALVSRITTDGYELDMMIPREVLTGFDPREYPSLGFHFVLVDREIGNRYFLTSPPLPHDQDPSLWGALELVE